MMSFSLQSSLSRHHPPAVISGTDAPSRKLHGGFLQNPMFNIAVVNSLIWSLPPEVTAESWDIPVVPINRRKWLLTPDGAVTGLIKHQR